MILHLSPKAGHKSEQSNGAKDRKTSNYLQQGVCLASCAQQRSVEQRNLVIWGEQNWSLGHWVKERHVCGEKLGSREAINTRKVGTHNVNREGDRVSNHNCLQEKWKIKERSFKSSNSSRIGWYGFLEYTHTHTHTHTHTCTVHLPKCSPALKQAKTLA